MGKMMVWSYFNKDNIELCPDEMFNNFDFIKFMIDTYKNDIDFVIRIVKRHEECNSKYLVELDILMSTLYQNTKDERLVEYDKRAKRYVEYFDFKMNMGLLSFQQQGYKGIGFIFIKDNPNPIILEYVVSIMLDRLLSKSILEAELHSKFKSFSDISSITNYLINYINSIDTDLSNYVSLNIKILNPTIKIVNEIEKEWDSFNENKLIEGLSAVSWEVEHYLEYNCDDMSVTVNDVLGYVIRLLHLEDIFKGYDKIDVSSKLMTPKCLMYGDMKCIKYMTELLDSLFIHINYSEEYYSDEKDVKSLKKNRDNIIDFKKHK